MYVRVEANIIQKWPKISSNIARELLPPLTKDLPPPPFLGEKLLKNIQFEYPLIDYSMLVQFFVLKFCSRRIKLIYS